MITKFQAVYALVGGELSQLSDGSFRYRSGQTPPTEKAIEAKLTELQNAEPMRVLREERDRKLLETDWWCVSDRTPTQAQLDYRTALRDLPSTAKPKLDENENLTGVTWPNKPE